MLRYLGTITAAAGRARNNLNTGASVLDLATLAAGKLDTKVRAHLGGVAGDLWKISATGDSAAGAGVTIAVNQTTRVVAIHYESGVSTVADVEAALQALSGTDDKIDVDVAGTPATVLAAPADNFAATALASGAAGAFDIPGERRKLVLLTTAADAAVEIGATYINTTSTAGLLMRANVREDFALGGHDADAVVAIYSAGGATLRVWAAA